MDQVGPRGPGFLLETSREEDRLRQADQSDIISQACVPRALTNHLLVIEHALEMVRALAVVMRRSHESISKQDGPRVSCSKLLGAAWLGSDMV